MLIQSDFSFIQHDAENIYPGVVMSLKNVISQYSDSLQSAKCMRCSKYILFKIFMHANTHQKATSDV